MSPEHHQQTKRPLKQPCQTVETTARTLPTAQTFPWEANPQFSTRIQMPTSNKKGFDLIFHQAGINVLRWVLRVLPNLASWEIQFQH